jgi:hypothetical protein
VILFTIRHINKIGICRQTVRLHHQKTLQLLQLLQIRLAMTGDVAYGWALVHPLDAIYPSFGGGSKPPPYEPNPDLRLGLGPSVKSGLSCMKEMETQRSNPARGLCMQRGEWI